MNTISSKRVESAPLGLQRLKDRVAIISGGANGVGAASCRFFAAEGAKVASIDRDVDAGKILQAELAEKGAESIFIGADVSIPEQVKQAVGKVVEWNGKIDILFNHAGIIVVKPFLDYTLTEWDEMMDNNAKSAFLMTQQVLPSMLERGVGSIIFTSSTAVKVCSRTESVYIASKAAMHQLARAIAVEYRDSGVRCNAICPNFIRTNHGVHEMTQLRKYGVLASENDVNTLQGRICEPEEVAAVAVFLASDEASFINGAEMFVDNTFTAV